MLRWVTEVRVHGVSGTPASSILRTDPRRVDTEDASASDPVRRRRSDGVQVFAPEDDLTEIADVPLRRVAYNWSDLTSGRRRHALWLLLLPYTLVNTAGWMLPAARRGETRIGFWPSAMVRLGGVIVTAVFALFALAISLDLFVYSCVFDSLVTEMPQTCRGTRFAVEHLGLDTLVTLGSLLPAAAVSVLGYVIGYEPRRRRLAAAAFAAGDAEASDSDEDPARTRTITDRRLWRSHAVGWQLTILHGAAAFATVGIVMYSIIHLPGSTYLRDPYFWTSVVLVPAAVFGAVMAASANVHTGNRYTGIVLAVGGLTLGTTGALVLRIQEFNAAILTTSPSWARPLTLTLIGITVVISVILVISGRPDPAKSIPPAALLLLAPVVGAVFGSGAYLLVLSVLGRGEAPPPEWFPGMDWISLSFLLFILVALGAISAWLSWSWRQDDGDSAMAGLMRGLREMTSGVLGLLSGVVLLLLVLLFVFTILGAGGDDGTLVSPYTVDGDLVGNLELITGVAVALAIAGVVSLTWRYLIGSATGERAKLRPWVALAVFAVVVVGIVGVVLILSAGRVGSIEAFGASLDFSSTRQIAMSVAVLVPIVLIGSRIRASFGNRDARRGLAVVWDLGSFWPRWYHPLAAPSYTPVAVPDLQVFIDELSRDDTAVILAAHSQGTVLGMVSLLSAHLSDDQLRRVAFLTYGSPIAHLYEKLFPAHFDRARIDQLCQMFTQEDTALWLNLWRDTDPIGGPIGRDEIDVDLGADPDGSGHSAYEATPGYKMARGTLAAGILDLFNR